MGTGVGKWGSSTLMVRRGACWFWVIGNGGAGVHMAGQCLIPQSPSISSSFFLNASRSGTISTGSPLIRLM